MNPICGASALWATKPSWMKSTQQWLKILLPLRLSNTLKGRARGFATKSKMSYVSKLFLVTLCIL